MISSGEWACPICGQRVLAFEMHTHDAPAGTLVRAIEAAEDRKLAAIGEEKPGAYVADPDGTRRVFSGFDLDHEELGQIAERAARMFCQLAHAQPLEQAFLACWCDALLVGLMCAQVAAQDAREPSTSS